MQKVHTYMYVAMVTIHVCCHGDHTHVCIGVVNHYVAMVNTIGYTAVTCRDKLGGCQNIIAVSLASSSSFDWLVGHLKVFVQILTHLCWVGTLHEWLKGPTL